MHVHERPQAARSRLTTSVKLLRARYRLGGPSSIQTSLAALVKQDLVLKEGAQYVVVDSLLREWIARRTF